MVIASNLIQKYFIFTTEIKQTQEEGLLHYLLVFFILIFIKSHKFIFQVMAFNWSDWTNVGWAHYLEGFTLFYRFIWKFHIRLLTNFFLVEHMMTIHSKVQNLFLWITSTTVFRLYHLGNEAFIGLGWMKNKINISV